jgi:hypothetical protein
MLSARNQLNGKIVEVKFLAWMDPSSIGRGPGSCMTKVYPGSLDPHSLLCSRPPLAVYNGASKFGRGGSVADRRHANCAHLTCQGTSTILPLRLRGEDPPDANEDLLRMAGPLFEPRPGV